MLFLHKIVTAKDQIKLLPILKKLPKHNKKLIAGLFNAIICRESDKLQSDSVKTEIVTKSSQTKPQNKNT